MQKGKYVVKNGTLTTDTGTTGLIDTTGDVAVVDVSDMENIAVYVNQIVDAGTVALGIDYSPDGTNWIRDAATKAETDFTAGTNQAELALTLSDANGMPIRAKLVRVRATAVAGGGTYGLVVTGSQVLLR